MTKEQEQTLRSLTAMMAAFPESRYDRLMWKIGKDRIDDVKAFRDAAGNLVFNQEENLLIGIPIKWTEKGTAIHLAEKPL
jgi:hypothetical protein